jgi:hypothetical protein
MCDNMTRFSKWSIKPKPHLSENILICAVHLAENCLEWHGKRGCTLSISTTRTSKRPRRPSINSWSVQSAVSARLWRISSTRPLRSSCSITERIAQLIGSKSIGRVSVETTCLHIVKLAVRMTTMEPNATGVVELLETSSLPVLSVVPFLLHFLSDKTGG